MVLTPTSPGILASPRREQSAGPGARAEVEPRLGYRNSQSLSGFISVSRTLLAVLAVRIPKDPKSGFYCADLTSQRHKCKLPPLTLPGEKRGQLLSGLALTRAVEQSVQVSSLNTEQTRPPVSMFGTNQSFNNISARACSHPISVKKKQKTVL